MRKNSNITKVSRTDTGSAQKKNNDHTTKTVKSNPFYEIDENGKMRALPLNLFGKQSDSSKKLSKRTGLDDNAGSTQKDVKNLTTKPVKSNPFFEIDESGKVKVLPMKLFFEERDSPKKTLKRSKHDEDREIPNKKRRTEITYPRVKKELFKVPASDTKFSNENKKTINKMRKPSRLLRPIDANLLGNTLNESGLSMLVEDVENEVSYSQSIDFKFGESKSTVKYDYINKSESPKNSRNNKTPNRGKSSTSSTEEFLELEKITEENMSPISSVCNKLENTALSNPKVLPNNVTSEQNINVQNLIENIQQIIEEDQLKFEEYKVYHEGNMLKISKILSDLSSYDNLKRKNTQIKENIFRRQSPRLHNISNKQNTSPAILKKDDLRRSALTKNLSKNLVKMESPKIKRAVEMYNKLKNDNSILCTPKFTNDHIISSRNSNDVCRSLSLKIQNQCLMLQDTPAHK